MIVGRTAVACLLLAGCKREPAPPGFVGLNESGDEGTPIATDGATDTDIGEPIEPGADVCLSAGAVGVGIHEGDLRGKDSNNGGACEQGGPDVFFVIDVPLRADVMVYARGAGYEPRVGVRHTDCASAFEDTGLLCVAGVPGWITDVARGTHLIVSVGIDPEAPAFASEAALPFELEVDLRPVLSRGESCVPASVGRCEAGTRCDTDEVPSTCVAVPGDTCGNAIALPLRAGSTTVEIPVDAIHDDAHEHSCAGARMPDRVYRVELLAEPGADARVEIDAPWSEGLAARGPGCLPEQELACAADGDLLVVATPPPSFYLFVELPDPAERDPSGGEEAPHEVRIAFDP